MSKGRITDFFKAKPAPPPAPASAFTTLPTAAQVPPPPATAAAIAALLQPQDSLSLSSAPNLESVTSSPCTGSDSDSDSDGTVDSDDEFAVQNGGGRAVQLRRVQTTLAFKPASGSTPAPGPPARAHGPRACNPFTRSRAALLLQRQLLGPCGVVGSCLRAPTALCLARAALPAFGAQYCDWVRAREPFLAGVGSRSLQCLAFDAPGVLLACGAEDGALTVLHMDDVHAAAQAQRNRVGPMLSTSSGETLAPAKLNPVYESRPLKRDLSTCVAWNPVHQYHVVCGSLLASTVTVFDVAADRPAPIAMLTPGPTFTSGGSIGVVYLPGGTSVVSNQDRGVRMWDLRASVSKPKWDIAEPVGALPPEAFGRSSSDPVWLAKDSVPPAKLFGGGNLPGALSLCADPHQLLVGYSDGYLRLFDIRKLTTPAFGSRPEPVPVTRVHVAALAEAFGVPLPASCPVAITNLCRSPRVPDMFAVTLASGLTVGLFENGGASGGVCAVFKDTTPTQVSSECLAPRKSMCLTSLHGAAAVAVCRGPGVAPPPTLVPNSVENAVAFTVPAAGLGLYVDGGMVSSKDTKAARPFRACGGSDLYGPSEPVCSAWVPTWDPLISIAAHPTSALLCAGTSMGELVLLSPRCKY